MPRTHRACWSWFAALGLLIAAPGCERGIIVRGDVGLELNHAPPVCSGCGSPGCTKHGGGGHGHGGGFPGMPGFAKGPSWPAEPYRHPAFHALPLGPIFDPRIEPAAFYDQSPSPAAQQSREPYWEPHVAPPRPPQQELWVDPPSDSTYELPVPDMTSNGGPGEGPDTVEGPEFEHSGYDEQPPLADARSAGQQNSGQWTRPSRRSPQPYPAPRRLHRPPNHNPARYPTNYRAPGPSYR